MKLLFLLSLLITNLQQEQESVLICMSPGSYAYHSGECRALQHCTHEIKRVTLTEAIDKYGKKKACGWCY